MNQIFEVEGKYQYICDEVNESTFSLDDWRYPIDFSVQVVAKNLDAAFCKTTSSVRRLAMEKGKRMGVMNILDVEFLTIGFKNSGKRVVE